MNSNRVVFIQKRSPKMHFYLIFASLQHGFEDHLELSNERASLQHGLLGAPHTRGGDQSHGLRDACSYG